MSQCTWKGKDQDRCAADATQPQIGSDNQQWANLCDAHAERMNNLVEKGPREMLGCWIAAGGGPKKMAERM